MAPQNSTLLHENTELSNELSHYSPIPKEPYCIEICINNTYTDEIIRPGKSTHKYDRVIYEQVENEIPIWICGEPRFVSGITNNTTCSDLIQALIDDELNSSTVDVTASRDLNDYVITEKWRDVEQALPGDTKILPIWMAWGSVQNENEVKFKLKINKNKAGTKIAGDYSNDNGDANRYDKRHKQDERHRRSAAVAQLMKRLIDQGESIKQQLDILRVKNDQSSLRGELGSKKYPSSLLNSFLHDTMRLDSMALSCSDGASTSRETKIIAKVPQRRQPEFDTTNDELFLMIDDGTGINTDETDSNVHVEYRQYYLNKKLDLAVAAAKVSVSNANAIPKRKSIPRKLEFDALRQNYHNKRLIKHLCENINQRQIRHRQMPAHGNKDNHIHREIDKLMMELQQLSAREEQLMKNLSAKCDRYRNQNNKYMTNLRLKLCIDEVQHNLDVYAKDIIENELELHEIQVEIQQKYDTLFNLTKKAELFNNFVFDNDDNTFNTTMSNNKSLII
ncbi:uncharacterized protein LOC129578341 [Sitodiplosis mosellana]|uniref:uncharacterized protein LOC129578341 n=1 Tax=Sitodiplosis mosellana TaxID=263140 RepID=UPI002444BB8B|nr:uncharacterized protein LOC129578341 [Sitodiplosis mosellana]XP_055322715.1 uncharacterized protein LOC129578341 [Sitodiplosis mosellana]XP_055322716.1 uncharacterized protein LOC129578341 [Sitodiplosis mosellana]